MLGELIGAGGMGRVYRAQDTLLGREVALKLLDAAEDGREQAWLAEARAAARLAHPAIAGVLDCGVHAGRGFIVSELVPGRPLDAILRGRGPLPIEETVRIAARLADALEAAHRRGVVHCDVKPHNVIVTPEGEPKLVDFGVARVLATTDAGGAAPAVGSAAYLAPEQVSGGPLGPHVDIYSLGAVLYELLTGRPPFDGPNAAAVIYRRLVSDPEPPQALNPAVPAEVGAVALRALAREPARRYPTAAELRDALLVAGRAHPASPTSVSERRAHDPAPPVTASRTGALVLGVVAVLSVLLLATLAGVTGRQDPPPATAAATPGGGPGAAASPAVGVPSPMARPSPAEASPGLAFTPFWVRNHRLTEMWSGPAGEPGVVSLGTTSHQFCVFLVVRPEVRGRLYVLNPYSNDYLWIDAGAVGPVDPPERRPGQRGTARNCARNDVR